MVAGKEGSSTELFNSMPAPAMDGSKVSAPDSRDAWATLDERKNTP